MGFFGSKKFAPKKSTMRRAQSLNSLKDPIVMQREFNPDPNNVITLEFISILFKMFSDELQSWRNDSES